MIERNLGVKLVVDDWTLRSTGTLEYRKSGRETLKRLRANHKDRHYELRNYMAVLHKSQDNICTDWSMEDGWSIWSIKEAA